MVLNSSTFQICTLRIFGVEITLELYPVIKFRALNLESREIFTIFSAKLNNTLQDPANDAIKMAVQQQHNVELPTPLRSEESHQLAHQQIIASLSDTDD